MAELKFFKDLSLPGTPAADSVYFIINGNYAETYVTDSAGNTKMVGNTAMINAIGGGGASQEVQQAANITARDGLSLTANTLVYVTDASADATVTSGGALYFWDNTGSTFIKVAEFESMDIVASWANLTGKPSSTPASIDQAVTDSHTHANKTVLDGITNVGSGAIITAAERTNVASNTANNHTHANKADLDLLSVVGGVLQYNGNAVKNWNSLAW